MSCPYPNLRPRPRPRRLPPTRRARSSDCAAGGEPALFFDETRVPVQTINVPNPEIDGLAPDQYEVIGQKISHRLAQRPGSYVILKYVRPVIKRCDTQVISCPAAPGGVIEGSRADVSFVAGVVPTSSATTSPCTASTSVSATMASGSRVRGSHRSPMPRSHCLNRSLPRSWTRFVRAGSRPWTRPRSRPAAAARAREGGLLLARLWRA